MGGNEDMQRELLDKFSDLPEDIIDIILRLMPLQDAVRTSILSTKWRHYWTRTQSLLLDWDFFYEILDHGPEDDIFDAVAYVSIIGSILSSHCGPIHEFYLHVPHFGLKPLLHQNAINNWVHSVSSCGVQDLTLDFDDAHPLPSSLFQCIKLKHLCLRFVKLELPPHNFRKLSSLVSLDFICVSLSMDMLTSIIANCPLLERFSIDYSSIHFEDGLFILTAPKLKFLSIQYLVNMFFLLKNNPNITTLSIQRTGEFCEEDYSKEGQDIIDFFGAIPEIENINIHSDVLVEWAKKAVPERLPALPEKLTNLIIIDLDMTSPKELLSLFCLIKSSPKLQTLDISMCLSHNVEPRDTRDYLESQIRQARNLRSLKTVRLTHVMGEEPEMIFIEIILTWCPNLEKLYLNSSSDISSEAEYKMMTNIMRFRRASTQAEVIYSKPE